MDQELSIEGNELRASNEVIARNWTPEEFIKHFIFEDSDDVEPGQLTGRFCSAEELLNTIDEAIEDSREN